MTLHNIGHFGLRLNRSIASLILSIVGHEVLIFLNQIIKLLACSVYKNSENNASDLLMKMRWNYEGLTKIW